MSGSNGTTSHDDFPIAIIGAGFSGLCIAIHLKRAGIKSFMILEAADDIGGTWRDNTYPGCACDVPSHLYSFSFEQDPSWSRMFGRQAEILDYLKHCVDMYGLRPHLRFNSRVVHAAFDQDRASWRLRTEDDREYSARVVVSGTGPLNKPAYPSFPGQEKFAGVSFHSSHWRHDFELQGKRVAVIGTGASSIQFVPQIAPKVDRLYLFQRTPPWIMPKRDRAYTALQKKLFRWFPPIQWLSRSMIYWFMELGALGFVRYPKLLRYLQKFALRHLKESVADPELRRRLTPDYTLGCKRILISNDFYPALTRQNVDLVTNKIVEVTARSIMTDDGVEREIDAIIYGTGFRVYDFLSPMEVIGLGGQNLNDCWRDGIETFYGLAVSGFPNFYMLIGPNTGLGHNSMVFMIESQVHYIMQCIKALRNGRHRYLDVKPGTQRAFNQRLQTRMRNTVWLTGCSSWYLTKDGRNFTLWPGFTFEYWMQLRKFKRRDFQIA